ncbi:hypothetical protein TrRE_jg960, partial [Triparma retinervis]
SRSGRPPQSAFKNPVPSRTPSIYMTFVSVAPGFEGNRKGARGGEEEGRGRGNIVKKADERNERYRRNIRWDRRGRRTIRKFLILLANFLHLGSASGSLRKGLRGRERNESIKISESARKYRDVMEIWGGRGEGERFIRAYLKWRNESDAARKERMYTYMTMVKLCEHDEEDPKAPPPRAKPNDPIAKFLVECGEEGIVRTILSFFGETRGKGDLRGATKAELLAVGLDLKVLRKENNADNSRHWGVRVHANGEIIGSDDEESDDEESNDEESDDEESNDEESNDEESDDEESDSDY